MRCGSTWSRGSAPTARDLARAGGQLRFRVAADGRMIYEDAPSRFEKFWLEAVHFWCEAGPVIRDGYAQVLARLRQ